MIRRAAIIYAAAIAAAAPSHTAAEPRYLPGWPLAAGSFHDSSPAVADVDGDGRREIALAAWDGEIILLDSQGRQLPGYPVATSARGGEQSSPVLADLDGDKVLELVFASADGRLYAFDNGGMAVPGWPKELGSDGTGGAAVQDFTRYRGLEVFATATDKIYGFHGNGTYIAGWPVPLDETAPTMPAVGDLDGDSTPEVVVAAGNSVYAFKTSGVFASGWPAELDGKIVAAPILADVDGDDRAEVLVGTAAGSAYVLEADGGVRAGWPQQLGSKPLTVPAAVGDLDGRGELTLAFVAGATYLTGATIGAFDADGRSRPGFPKQLNRTVAAAPLAVDADGDGLPEILLVTYDGSLLSFERDGSLTAGFPVKLLADGVTSTPAATDVDNDGFMDLVVAAQNGYIEVVATDGAFEPSANPWPMYGGNHWRTGKYIAPARKRQDFTLAARGGGVTIRWRAGPRDRRAGWAILKGIHDYVCDKVLYYEMAYVEEQPTASYSYRDEEVDDGTVYYYKLEERMSSGATYSYGPKAIRAVGGGGAEARSTITRCYPNPFTTQVSIAYEVGAAAEGSALTTISIYDLSGKLIRYLVNENKTPGKYIAEWDGTDSRGAPVASGVYLANLRVGEDAPPSTKTVVLIR
jgi:hypothetical protein